MQISLQLAARRLQEEKMLEMADRVAKDLVGYKASVIGNLKKPVQSSISSFVLVNLLGRSLPLVCPSFPFLFRFGPPRQVLGRQRIVGRVCGRRVHGRTEIKTLRGGSSIDMKHP